MIPGQIGPRKNGYQTPRANGSQTNGPGQKYPIFFLNTIFRVPLTSWDFVVFSSSSYYTSSLC